MNARATDKLVSTAALTRRLGELRKEIKRQKRYRADEDPFFVHTEWMLAEFEEAIRDAAREYVAIGDAARLTHWDQKTLYKYARAAHAGEALPAEWAGLLVRFEGGRWSVCLSTVPYRPASPTGVSR